MESNKNLVFIGMMGSGKTTLGKIVSKKLNMKFIDIDHEIESKENMKISDLFKKKGEVFFRKLEERISLQNLKKNNSVISLGGGAFINKKVQKEVLKNHKEFKEAVLINKKKFLKKFSSKLIYEQEFQPNLCTYVNKKIVAMNKNIILYKSRSNTEGSIVSHIGEVHLGIKAKGLIIDKIK